MMNDLINEVTQKAGISPDQAQAAVNAVLGLLKERLPAPVAGILGSLVHGGQGNAAVDTENSAAGASGLAGEAEALLGNFFGSKG